MSLKTPKERDAIWTALTGNPERAADALYILNAIDELRKEEGASVLICCSNPEGNGPDNEAVEVIDDWTNWQPARFRGSTLRIALENAVHEKKPRAGK